MMKPAPWNMWCMARDLSLPCIKYCGKTINNEIKNMADVDFRGEKRKICVYGCLWKQTQAWNDYTIKKVCLVCVCCRRLSTSVLDSVICWLLCQVINVSNLNKVPAIMCVSVIEISSVIQYYYLFLLMDLFTAHNWLYFNPGAPMDLYLTLSFIYPFIFNPLIRVQMFFAVQPYTVNPIWAYNTDI